LRAVAFRRLRNFADVDEALQETYLRALQTNDPHLVHSPRAIGVSIIRNLSIDQIRHSQVVPMQSIADFDGNALDQIADPNANIERDHADKELVILAKAAFRGLPEKCRQAFILRKVFSLSYKQIARVMKISVNTVEQHLSKAVVMFDAALGEIEGFERRD
jgi:RNA polymerase sigma factor (sigma-70 family)